MIYSKKFISGTKQYNTYSKHVNAPILRKEFLLDKLPEKAELTITALGFYEFYLNGKKLTRGALSPNITNPDNTLYYDNYDITEHLKVGGNAIAFVLGNGMQNTDFKQWDFHKASFRSAPKVALALELDNALFMEADESFKCANSPITYDDLRSGEYYDARQEKVGFSLYGYDDSKWTQALLATTPKGRPTYNDIPPIRVTDELKPVRIIRGLGYCTFDFGVNTAGVVRLKLNGIYGQKLLFTIGETLYKNRACQSNLKFSRNQVPKNYFQNIIYISAGNSEEYTPSFTYFGGRYVTVKGLKPSQINEDTLTFLVMNTDFEKAGDFISDDEVLNKLQEMVVRSNKANYYHFPTDCPQREKNGWTGDANLSAEQLTLNHDTQKAFINWLKAMVDAQRADGRIPAIVPTDNWGYGWGSGPNWDAALFELPYVIYKYYGDKSIIELTADAMVKYLGYLESKISAENTVEYGLGDWCQIGVKHREYDTPIVVSDTLAAIDFTIKASIMLEVVGDKEGAQKARELSTRLRNGFRTHLISKELEVKGSAQTAQAMAIYYGAFEKEEVPTAYKWLKKYIERDGGQIKIGVIGNRVLFRLLSDMGDVDLAYKLIAQKEKLSFAQWIKEGATTMREEFTILNNCAELSRKDKKALRHYSLNHHFWGDISAWMIKYLGGICVNPSGHDAREVVIKPCIPSGLNYVKAWYRTIGGVVSTERKGNLVKIIVPDGIKATLDYKGNLTQLSVGENEVEL